MNSSSKQVETNAFERLHLFYAESEHRCMFKIVYEFVIRHQFRFTYRPSYLSTSKFAFDLGIFNDDITIYVFRTQFYIDIYIANRGGQLRI